MEKEKPRREALDLNDIFLQVVDLLRGLSIGTELRPELATVYGDPVQLQQVILNLILNGAASMKNAPLAQRRIIVRTAMVSDLTVQASVTDFGVGIDETHIERIFEPFYTNKPEGLGMGLSIIRPSSRSTAGKWEFKTTPGEGPRSISHCRQTVKRSTRKRGRRCALLTIPGGKDPRAPVATEGSDNFSLLD